MSKIIRGIFGGGSPAPMVIQAPPLPPPPATAKEQLPKTAAEQLPDQKQAQASIDSNLSAIEEEDRRRKRAGRASTVIAGQRLGDRVGVGSVAVKTLLGQ